MKNVVSHLPPMKQWKLGLEATDRVKAVGMIGVQVGKSIEILARGEVLLTWRRPDGKHHFCGLGPKSSIKFTKS